MTLKTDINYTSRLKANAILITLRPTLSNDHGTSLFTILPTPTQPKIRSDTFYALGENEMKQLTTIRVKAVRFQTRAASPQSSSFDSVFPFSHSSDISNSVLSLSYVVTRTYLTQDVVSYTYPTTGGQGRLSPNLANLLPPFPFTPHSLSLPSLSLIPI